MKGNEGKLNTLGLILFRSTSRVVLIAVQNGSKILPFILAVVLHPLYTGINDCSRGSTSESQAVLWQRDSHLTGLWSLLFCTNANNGC